VGVVVVSRRRKWLAVWLAYEVGSSVLLLVFGWKFI